MQIYQQRRKFRRFFSSRPFLIFLGLVAFFMFIASVRRVFLAIKAHEAREKAEAEYARLLAQKERLDKKIEALNDEELLQKEAKERFNVTAPGEKVLIIVEPKIPKENLAARPHYVRFWEFLKNIFR